MQKSVPFTSPDAPFFNIIFLFHCLGIRRQQPYRPMTTSPLVLYAANHPAHYSICLPPPNSSTHVRPFDCCVDPRCPPVSMNSNFPPMLLAHILACHHCCHHCRCLCAIAIAIAVLLLPMLPLSRADPKMLLPLLPPRHTFSAQATRGCTQVSAAAVAAAAYFLPQQQGLLKPRGSSQPETERAQPSGHWQWHDNAVESVVVVVVPTVVAVFVVIVSIIPIGANAMTTIVARDVVARTGSQSATSPMTQH
jgi:hypothetical protein